MTNSSPSPTTITSTDPTLVVRTARKPWRCICADPIDRWEVTGHYGNGSWAKATARSADRAEDLRTGKMAVGAPATT